MFLKALAALVFLLAMPSAQQDTVQKFPEGLVRQEMTRVVENFNREFGDYARIVRIEAEGTVSDPARSVDDMLKTAIIVDSGTESGRPALVQLDPGKLALDQVFYLRDSLLRNVAKGDILIVVTLRDQKSGATMPSVNSMATDSSRFSGVFLSMTRVRSQAATATRLPNTVCERLVVSSYLWGKPAEQVVGCVRAMCEGERCVDCVITKADGFPGFFGDVKIVPEAGVKGRMPNSKCCDGYFKYTWVTGFKSLKVSSDKLSLEVDGRIGQSGNGSFTAQECCDKPQ